MTRNVSVTGENKGLVVTYSVCEELTVVKLMSVIYLYCFIWALVKVYGILFQLTTVGYLSHLMALLKKKKKKCKLDQSGQSDITLFTNMH